MLTEEEKRRPHSAQKHHALSILHPIVPPFILLFINPRIHHCLSIHPLSIIHMLSSTPTSNIDPSSSHQLIIHPISNVYQSSLYPSAVHPSSTHYRSSILHASICPRKDVVVAVRSADLVKGESQAHPYAIGREGAHTEWLLKIKWLNFNALCPAVRFLFRIITRASGIFFLNA